MKPCSACEKRRKALALKAKKLTASVKDKVANAIPLKGRFK